jgi:hypothetical protein
MYLHVSVCLYVSMLHVNTMPHECLPGTSLIRFVYTGDVITGLYGCEVEGSEDPKFFMSSVKLHEAKLNALGLEPQMSLDILTDLY